MKGVQLLWSVPTLHERVKLWKEITGITIDLYVEDLLNEKFPTKF